MSHAASGKHTEEIRPVQWPTDNESRSPPHCASSPDGNMHRSGKQKQHPPPGETIPHWGETSKRTPYRPKARPRSIHIPPCVFSVCSFVLPPFCLYSFSAQRIIFDIVPTATAANIMSQVPVSITAGFITSDFFSFEGKTGSISLSVPAENR